ncbi:PE family protein [Mycobacterium terramassiliense]|uniref:PE family protein n=1 Tax=Mycobacterium terramassiliense TaxID=1841859 RepID=A0A2U3NKJ2_9MYCO|nr:PE family protein [Mycobacterium terramassiliense]SPM32051.1 PE family protein [Mycobacterium terramassiliense]
MSVMTVVPEFVGQAAGQLENIGSALSAAHAAAAGPTTGVVAAAGDEVSTAIAALFSSHAQQYQALNAQAAAFHAQFTSALNAGAASYLNTEIASAQAAAAPPGFQAIGTEILSVLQGSSAQQIELPLDLVGPLVAARGPLAQGATAFVSAVQAGNSAAAMAALANAGPSVETALLYGQDTVSIPLPGSVPGVQSVALNIPFGGLLAPLQPVTVNVTTTGNPPIIAPTGFEVGGFVTNLQANGPEVLLALLLLGVSFV